MALIYDLAEPQELVGFVRAIADEQERNRFVLSQFLPNKTIDDIEYRITKGDTTDEDAAKIRAWDTESPIGDRRGLSRLMGELPPISKKIRLGEEDRLRRQALERNGDIRPLVDAIFDDAAKMTRAVTARIEMLRGEALANASIAIDENGVAQTVDFGRDASLEVDMATDFSEYWSNTAATVVQDVRSMVDVYRDLNGVDPGVILTSTTAISNLLRNAEIRTLASSLSGAPSIVSRETLNAVFSAFGLPPFVAYDVKVRVDGVATRVIPSNLALFLPPASEPLGNTLLGTTAEALELAGASQVGVDQAPGLVAVVEKTFDPVATWTKVAGIALPVLGNPDLTAKLQVLA